MNLYIRLVKRSLLLFFKQFPVLFILTIPWLFIAYLELVFKPIFESGYLISPFIEPFYIVLSIIIPVWTFAALTKLTYDLQSSTAKPKDALLSALHTNPKYILVLIEIFLRILIKTFALWVLVALLLAAFISAKELDLIPKYLIRISCSVLMFMVLDYLRSVYLFLLPMHIVERGAPSLGKIETEVDMPKEASKQLFIVLFSMTMLGYFIRLSFAIKSSFLKWFKSLMQPPNFNEYFIFTTLVIWKYLSIILPATFSIVVMVMIYLDFKNHDKEPNLT